MSVGECVEFICKERNIDMNQSYPRVEWVDELIDEVYKELHNENEES